MSSTAVDRASGPAAGYDGQWILIWRRFRRHKLGLIGGIVTLFIYLVALFAEFLAPHDPGAFSTRNTYAPPQAVHWFVERDGRHVFRPHVLGYKTEIDYDSGRRTFMTDPEMVIPVGLFVRGHPYRFLGLIPSERHLFGTINPKDRAYFLMARESIPKLTGYSVNMAMERHTPSFP